MSIWVGHRLKFQISITFGLDMGRLGPKPNLILTPSYNGTVDLRKPAVI